MLFMTSPKVMCCWIGHGKLASPAKSGMGSGLSPKPWNETNGDECSGLSDAPRVVGEGR
jgi:hypothetical protein